MIAKRSRLGKAPRARQPSRDSHVMAAIATSPKKKAQKCDGHHIPFWPKRLKNGSVETRGDDLVRPWTFMRFRFAARQDYSDQTAAALRRGSPHTCTPDGLRRCHIAGGDHRSAGEVLLARARQPNQRILSRQDRRSRS